MGKQLRKIESEAAARSSWAAVAATLRALLLLVFLCRWRVCVSVGGGVGKRENALLLCCSPWQTARKVARLLPPPQ